MGEVGRWVFRELGDFCFLVQDIKVSYIFEGFEIRVEKILLFQLRGSSGFVIFKQLFEKKC